MFHPKGPSFWELAYQALSSTERGYDLLARKFDYTPFRTPQWILDAVVPHIGSCRRAVDLCCGTGAAMETLRPLASECVVGLDFSRPMLEVARETLPAAPGTAELLLVRGNAMQLPLAQRFDLAVCFGALGHIPRREEGQFVEQIAEILEPGGRFVFVTSTLPPITSLPRWLSRGFNAAMHVRNLLVRPPFIMFYLTFLLPEIQATLQQHGFQVEVRDEPLLERPYLKVVVATRT